MTIDIHDDLLIPEQIDWLNESYTEDWKHNILPLYKILLKKCTVIEIVERKTKPLAVGFKTKNGAEIRFYPHWIHPLLNGNSITHQDLINQLL